MIELEQRDRIQMTFSDHIADHVTALAGSMLFVWLHVVWFTAWILVNSPVVGSSFDPYPFGLLTMIVSLEAIFLSTFVLISQNRQALQGDKRTKVDLQVNMIAEQEITKLVEMVSTIQEHFGLSIGDAEVARMQKETHVLEVAETLDQAERELVGDAAKGPNSAVDTEA